MGEIHTQVEDLPGVFARPVTLQQSGPATIDVEYPARDERARLRGRQKAWLSVSAEMRWTSVTRRNVSGETSTSSTPALQWDFGLYRAQAAR